MRLNFHTHINKSKVDLQQRLRGPLHKHLRHHEQFAHFQDIFQLLVFLKKLLRLTLKGIKFSTSFKYNNLIIKVNLNIEIIKNLK